MGQLNFRQSTWIIIVAVVAIAGTLGGASAVQIFTEDIRVESSGANAIIESRADGGNAVVKMSDKGTSAYAFTVIDGQKALSITDITNSKNLMTFIESGFVGIGTNTPSAQLDVVGDLHLGGGPVNITSDGDICIGNCP